MGVLPNRFSQVLADRNTTLAPTSIETLQLNITKLCNQACLHCHVDSSPRRREMMTDEVIEKCIELMASQKSIKNLDITGGAPELHSKFRYVVTKAKSLGKNVMVRHNLTVTQDPHPMTKESMAYLPEFFAEQRVEVISSLPYYQEYFTNKQRGDGVFQKSITALKELNSKGFGVEGSSLVINLVYNPVGAFLPAAQESLERDFKRELKEKFGITFNHLFAITNMPIHRFKAQLVRAKTYEDYMEKLLAAYNPEAASGVMCRSLISVAHDGKIFDCDFNQMLGMNIIKDDRPMTIFDFNETELLGRSIKFADHCFGCTAGAGSSCGGKTA